MLGREKGNTSGFTLFELLAAIAVMTILLGIALGSLAQRDDIRSLDSAQSQLHALLRLARSQAILEGAEARLIVNFDETDEERFLRYVGVIVEDHEDIDGDANTDWIAATDGLFLPRGIFVVPQSKVTFANWNTSDDSDRKSDYRRENTDSGGLAIEEYDYPVGDPIEGGASGKPEWICFGFGPDGKVTTVESSGLPPVGNHLALSSGGYTPDGKIVFEDSENVVGIRLRSNGNSFSVKDPEAL